MFRNNFHRFADRWRRATFELVLIAEDGGEVSGAGTFEAETQANIVAVESPGLSSPIGATRSE